MIARHLRSALHLAWTNKLRFLLTVSGIVVGVASLVLIASLLGVATTVLEAASAEAKGENVLVVQNDYHEIYQNPDARPLDRGDVRALERTVMLEGATVSANTSMRRVPARFADEDFTVLGLGVSEQTFEVHHLPLAAGRPFAPDDYASTRHVVILGAEVDDGKPKVGDTIKLDGRSMLVVGILEKKAEMGPGGDWGWNHRALVPQRTWTMSFQGNKDPQDIAVRVATPPDFVGEVSGLIGQARSVVELVLMRNRDVRSFRFEGADREDDMGETIGLVIELLLYLTTLFSMIVGGINIMNIMLVTVTERTTEIGVRRALGATRGEILWQFLAETTFIALLGALLGLVCALGLLGLATAALTHWVTEWPFRVEPWSVVVGMVFSTGVGLVFGMYPAMRASRLDPVQALRSE